MIVNATIPASEMSSLTLEGASSLSILTQELKEGQTNVTFSSQVTLPCRSYERNLTTRWLKLKNGDTAIAEVHFLSLRALVLDKVSYDFTANDTKSSLRLAVNRPLDLAVLAEAAASKFGCDFGASRVTEASWSAGGLGCPLPFGPAPSVVKLVV
jgi:hypothetical protein